MNTALTSSRSSCVVRRHLSHIDIVKNAPFRINLHAIAATRRNATDTARTFQVIACAVDVLAGDVINAADALKRRDASQQQQQRWFAHRWDALAAIGCRSGQQ